MMSFLVILQVLVAWPFGCKMSLSYSKCMTTSLEPPQDFSSSTLKLIHLDLSPFFQRQIDLLP